MVCLVSVLSSAFLSQLLGFVNLTRTWTHREEEISIEEMLTVGKFVGRQAFD